MNEIENAFRLVDELRVRAPRFLWDIKNSILATANQLERAAQAGTGTMRRQTDLRVALTRAEQQMDFMTKMDGVKGAASCAYRKRAC